MRVEIPLNPYQGLKPKPKESNDFYDIIVEIPLNPYQGLKQKEPVLRGEADPSRNSS